MHESLSWIKKLKWCAIVHCCVTLIQVDQYLIFELENLKNVLRDFNSSSTFEAQNLYKLHTHLWLVNESKLKNFESWRWKFIEVQSLDL